MYNLVNSRNCKAKLAILFSIEFVFLFHTHIHLHTQTETHAHTDAPAHTDFRRGVGVVFAFVASAARLSSVSFGWWYLLAAQSCLHTATHHKWRNEKIGFHVGNTPIKYSRRVFTLVHCFFFLLVTVLYSLYISYYK